MELSRLGVTAAYISFKEGHTQPLCFDYFQTTDGNRFLVEGADDEIVFLESAYIALQRGDCRAIYGAAAGLKKLLEGVQRAKLKYRVLPIWFSVDDFEKAKQQIAQNLADCLQKSNDVIMKQHDEDVLRDKHFEQDERGRQELQEQFRKQYGSAAHKFENDIYYSVKEYVESPKGKHMRVSQYFSTLTTWYENALRDGWEMVRIDSTIEDYGLVEWKSRVLEAGFVDIRIKMRNRDLGEYQDHCYVLAYILDKEFDIARDPIVAACNIDSVPRYKIAHRFSSKWVVPSSSTIPLATAARKSPTDVCIEWQEGTRGRDNKQ
jgi:hypothetical protein